jgi:hypothetical protein
MFTPDVVAQLLGRRIDAIHGSKESSTLTFETDQGPISWRAEGDCCSYSWFEEFHGVDALLGQTVTKAEYLGLEWCAGDGYDEPCLQDYGILLTTTWGRAKIVFRNSSNGHYGGSVEATDNHDLSGGTLINDDF